LKRKEGVLGCIFDLPKWGTFAKWKITEKATLVTDKK
jgi:hypothetical protein